MIHDQGAPVIMKHPRGPLPVLSQRLFWAQMRTIAWRFARALDTQIQISQVERVLSGAGCPSFLRRARHTKVNTYAHVSTHIYTLAYSRRMSRRNATLLINYYCFSHRGLCVEDTSGSAWDFRNSPVPRLPYLRHHKLV